MSGGDDWQVGDLALCIKQGRWRSGGRFAPSNGMKAGVIARVRRLGRYDDDTLTLWFDGWPGDDHFDGFSAERFRRIPPLTDEERDSFTAELRTDQRIPVEA